MGGSVMPKSFGYFMIIVTFILGVSVGVYGTNYYHQKEIAQQPQNEKILYSVQDKVIQKVQSGDLWKTEEESGKSDNENVIEVFIGEEKISPDAKLIIKKIFLKCQHSTVSIMDMPEGLINLSERELAKKYSGWEIEKFSSDEVIISREFDANCEDHFVIKESDGEVAIFNELTEDKLNFVDVINVDLDMLSEQDREYLREGIRVYGKSELGNVIEDFSRESGAV